MHLTFLALFVALACTILAYYKRSYQYWQRRGLNSLPPTIPLGHLTQKVSLGILIKTYYDEMRSKRWPHGGLYFFTKPMYLVLAPTLLKHILTKDFDHFVDRGFYYNEKVDPIGAHLFAVGGSKWRHLRTKLTPTFTSGKMRTMLPTMVECVAPMAALMDQFHQKGGPVDIKEVLACFTTDIIGSAAFGLDCNSFRDENSPFRTNGKRVVQLGKLEILKLMFANNFQSLAKFLRIRQIPKDISDFYFGVVSSTVEYRRRNNLQRPDFLQILIDMQAKTDLSLNEIVAQCFIFFFAGFETSSTTMTFALYELAEQQDIQDKVRDEIDKVMAKYDGRISYEAISELKYLNQVIEETLRKYPPIPVVTRDCIKDYKVPGEDLTIEKGTRTIIPIIGLHYDSEYFPDPEKFDPGRFSDTNRSQIQQYTYMPFGDGPRVCIGLRFGMMQTKVGLVSLLRNYKFTVNEATQVPIRFKASSFILAAAGEIWLNIAKLSK